MHGVAAARVRENAVHTLRTRVCFSHRATRVECSSVHINAVIAQTWSWLCGTSLHIMPLVFARREFDIVFYFFLTQVWLGEYLHKISYIDQWDLDYSIYYHNLSGHRQKFEKFGRILSQFLLTFLSQNIAKIQLFLMIKLFSYTYECVNMFIRINNQTFIFQKYLSIVSFRAGKLFTFFRTVRKHHVYFMQIRCRSQWISAR